MLAVGPVVDGDLMRRRGLYFTPQDGQFLDSAWSHINGLTGYRRDLAVAALVLSAAGKQPRGVALTLRTAMGFAAPCQFASGLQDWAKDQLAQR